MPALSPLATSRLHSRSLRPPRSSGRWRYQPDPPHERTLLDLGDQPPIGTKDERCALRKLICPLCASGSTRSSCDSALRGQIRARPAALPRIWRAGSGMSGHCARLGRCLRDTLRFGAGIGLRCFRSSSVGRIPSDPRPAGEICSLRAFLYGWIVARGRRQAPCTPHSIRHVLARRAGRPGRCVAGSVGAMVVGLSW